jgi:hypothetical protein
MLMAMCSGFCWVSDEGCCARWGALLVGLVSCGNILRVAENLGVAVHAGVSVVRISLKSS